MKKLGFYKTYNLVGGTLLWEDYEYPFAKDAGEKHGFSICPVLNSMLVIKKIKALLKTKYKTIFNSGDEPFKQNIKKTPHYGHFRI